MRPLCRPEYLASRLGSMSPRLLSHYGDKCINPKIYAPYSKRHPALHRSLAMHDSYCAYHCVSWMGFMPLPSDTTYRMIIVGFGAVMVALFIFLIWVGRYADQQETVLARPVLRKEVIQTAARLRGCSSSTWTAWPRAADGLVQRLNPAVRWEPIMHTDCGWPSAMPAGVERLRLQRPQDASYARLNAVRSSNVFLKARMKLTDQAKI